MYRSSILATSFATLVVAGAQPQAAAFDDRGDTYTTGSTVVCFASVVDLVLDVETGDMWLHHPPGSPFHEGPELLDDQTLYVAMASDTSLRLELTSGEAMIEVSPEGGETTTVTTDESVGSYVLPASEAPREYFVALDLLSPPTRVPSAPTILIRTRKTCPTGPVDDSNAEPE